MDELVVANAMLSDAEIDAIRNGTFGSVSVVVPTVTTGTVTSVAQNTATGAGNVTDAGNGTISERGVCWSTSANPTTANSKATAAGTTGAYTASITGLNPNTLYHVRAYAINEAGTSYGNDTSFTTLALSTPTITTGEITAVTTTTATGAGNVTSDGRATITARGYVGERHLIR